MLRFVLTLLLAILTLALFARLMATNRPFRATVLAVLVAVAVGIWWINDGRFGAREVMIPVPATERPAAPASR